MTMGLKGLTVLAGALALAGCATAYTPMEQHLNRYAGAEVVAQQCPAYGGYDAVKAMRADASTNLGQARAMGATEADVQKARRRVLGTTLGSAIFIGVHQTCNTMINGLAWAGTEPAVARLD